MRPLTVHTSIKPGYAGISLRGGCLTNADIQTLEDAFSQLRPAHGQQLWVDCRYLEDLSYQGQRALLWADNRARGLGLTLHWCGLPHELQLQLTASGLALLLHLLPALAYRGPAELVVVNPQPRLFA